VDIFQEAVLEIQKAASLANIDKKIIDRLSKGGEVIPLEFEAFTYSGMEAFEGVSVQQLNPYEQGGPNPNKGGIRFAEYPTADAMTVVTKRLSLDMEEKNGLTGLPFGGAKTCVNINPAKRKPEELVSVARELTIEMLRKNILDANIYVPGPDFGTNEAIMKTIYLRHARLNSFLHRPNPAAVVTGKPLWLHGCPGREDATARGGLIVLGKLIKFKKQAKFAVQGFGNVGKNCCKLLTDENFEEAGGQIIAVSEEFSGIYNPKGLNYADLQDYFDKYKTFNGCSLGENIKPATITEIECDVLISAAKESLIDENVVKSGKFGILLELGNAATTAGANRILEEREKTERRITVIPDILANPGGVIVSYFEWRKNRGDVAHEVDFAKDLNWVHAELREILEDSVRRALEAKKTYNVSMRTASHIVALKRIEKKIKQKIG